jgi:ATP-dependent Clp protease ATP-binding subunit ClpA
VPSRGGLELLLGQFAEILAARQPASVLLVGPSGVGKTTLMRELACRRADYNLGATPFWSTGGARLIAGMTGYGMWQERCTQVVREALRQRAVVHLGNLVELMQVGKSEHNALSIASFLRPPIARGELLAVAECTPEQLALAEREDPHLVAAFQQLGVPEPDAATGRAILRHFAANAPTAWPGRCRRTPSTRSTACTGATRPTPPTPAGRCGSSADRWPTSAPSRSSGRATSWTPSPAKPACPASSSTRGSASTWGGCAAGRQGVLEALARQVVGQEPALEAAADAIAIAKARLNDPGRPLGVFLFLGPTGVGKTECAKAIARYLFGDAERLLRFDLNEYGEPGAAARLVGTFAQPEGLLTSAIRRQGFAMVLFDEVEKADSEVFDVLLQVLGEGRLTDALGRTADFGNSLIVLTSNLGVREAESGLGLRQDEPDRAAAFVRAAERFFRPEFFNRIDRVIPFRRLSRAEVGVVARKVLAEVFGRERLVQRKCLLAVEPPALERIIDQGYDPVLGARALKWALSGTWCSRWASAWRPFRRARSPPSASTPAPTHWRSRSGRWNRCNR